MNKNTANEIWQLSHLHGEFDVAAEEAQRLVARAINLNSQLVARMGLTCPGVETVALTNRAMLEAQRRLDDALLAMRRATNAAVDARLDVLVKS